MLQALRVFLPMAEKIRNRNPSFDILNYLCINEGKMVCTDLETTVIVPIEDERSYTLPINIMKQIMKQKPATVEINLLNYLKVEIGFDNNKVIFPIEDIKEFPKNPDCKLTQIGIWPAEVFVKLYKQQSFVSKDESKPALKGIYIMQDKKEISSCATDSHIMQYLTNLQDIEGCKIMSEFKGIIPAHTIQLMAKFFRSKIIVYAGEDYICFELPNKIMVYSRLIDQEFPNVIPILEQENSGTIKVDRKAFLKAISTSKPFSNSSTKTGELVINNGSVSINTTDTEKRITFTTSVASKERHGKEMTIGFNMDYLEKTIKSINSEEVIWYYNNACGPSFFKSQDETDKIMLLMPVSLEEE